MVKKAESEGGHPWFGFSLTLSALLLSALLPLYNI